MFALSDEQRMLADMLDSALADGGTDWAAIAAATGLDLLGVPAEEGGLGVDIRDAAVVAAALGRANAGGGWAEHWVATRQGVRGPAPRAMTAANDPEVREAAADQLTLLHCAEMVGLSRTMLRDATAFARERRQFGTAIAAFQALRHRLVDMAMLLEQAEALTGAALDAIDARAEDAVRLLSAARVVCEEAARAVGEGAVQIHGAMGLTEELRLGGYFRRARVLMQGDGTARAHLTRYAA